MMTNEIDDLQERFVAAVAAWETMPDADRQSLIDQTAIEMTIQSFVDAGFVEGQGELDLSVCGMLYGYAYAKGYRANMSEDNIRQILRPDGAGGVETR